MKNAKGRLWWFSKGQGRADDRVRVRGIRRRRCMLRGIDRGRIRRCIWMGRCQVMVRRRRLMDILPRMAMARTPSLSMSSRSPRLIYRRTRCILTIRVHTHRIRIRHILTRRNLIRRSISRPSMLRPMLRILDMFRSRVHLR